MKNYLFLLLLALAAIPAFPRHGNAETLTISWNAVTTYTDGTPIEAGTVVTYNCYWTSDPGLGAASLRTIASAVSRNFATFDPDQENMPHGQTVYFTAEALLGTGEKSTLAAAYSWTVPGGGTPPTFISLSISGPSSVNEGGSGTYKATARWSDGSTAPVTPTWSENSKFATISAGGVLAAQPVPSNQAVTVAASYTTGGVTQTATWTVTIVDVPAGAVEALRNVAITGPVATSPARLFRLEWDAIERYADGTPIPEGTVRYSAFWTTDPGLSASNLMPLAASIAETSVTFDPLAEGISPNTRVYFTAVAAAPNGTQSPLAAGISWLAVNAGPTPPSGGVIKKR
jgi:hypothetical protein